MDTAAENLALIANRENLYRFLGRIYKVEADQALLAQMKRMRFPDVCGEPELDEGYRRLEAYLRTPGNDPLTDLAVDYARVFLSAGIAKEAAEAAYPYESVYTSPKRLIMQDARDQVLAIYMAKGLYKAEELAFPEDHLALELAFMAYLCHEAQAALKIQDWPAALASLQAQTDFLTQHLLNWVPAFCADIEKYAATEFYQAVAQITNSYLCLERTLLAAMIAEFTMAAAPG